MSQLRIAVLDATRDDENTVRNFRRELDASLSEFDVVEGELPDGFDYDGVVVTGSRSSVYWDEPWIGPVKKWVGDAIDHGVPCLGICWGHQLLADVLGGTVSDMGVYEVGYSRIEHDGRSRLFEGVGSEFTAFTSHSDEVAELPPGATSLAANEYSNHGFRKDRVFGVQFHPEYDPKTARELVRGKDLAEDRREAVLAEITEENYRQAGEATLVFENFLAFAREVRGEEGATGETGDAPAAGG
ncbi:type 1 glutamine amidotransferase [Halobacteria archaeon AArc-dxtr1]|nr:type 1 glutamine amidotransferase [Halobacteria archaeon AArc-dxtr1]